MGRTVVIGGTGNVGSRVAQALLDAGEDVRVVSRDPSGFADTRAEPHAADLTDTHSARAAVQGADAVYLTPPLAGDDPLVLERTVASNVIAAARELGVGHLLAHTALHADRGDTGVDLLDNKAGIEQEIAASGVPYTILRPAWFIQNLFGAKPYLEQGMFSMPWPEHHPWAATSVADIARAAIGFHQRGPANRGFDLHVPGGITAAEICDAVGQALGREIQYQQFDGPTRQFVDAYPLPDAMKDLYAGLFAYLRDSDYRGDPQAVAAALDDFRYSTAADVVVTELFPKG